jgi:P pilus assembly chaperone PapD
MKKYMALGAVLAALGAAGTAIGQSAAAGGGAAAAQADGGLSMLPVIVEHDTRPGPLATYTIANRSASPITVTVTPRPWVQSASGKVSPNRKATLSSQFSVSPASFTLAAGAEQAVDVALTSAPAGGSLFGALEVVGLPADHATRTGVVLGYRIVGSLRILPAVPKVSLVVGNAKAAGKTAVLPVKNAGNTIDAVSGRVRIQGASGTRDLSVSSVRILPGKTINVPVGKVLSSGSYTATLTLNQRGKRVVNVKKKFRVK